MHAEQLTGVVTHHGEGPVWSPRFAGPRWVDMLAGDICELQPDGEIRRRHVGAIAAMLRPRTTGGFVVLGERCLALSESDDLDADLRVLPDIVTRPGVRMNEGGCDPAGRLYVGSMAYDSAAGRGTLYRVDPPHAVTVVEPAVTVSNGIDWAQDGSRCYYVDSATHRIDQYDWSAAGIANRRPLAEVSGDGAPDGLTVDADGNIWVALFGGGQVRCYSPLGQLEQVIELPVSQVTAVAFAADDLKTLIITTSRHGLANPEANAGAIFTCTPGTSGLPIRAFTG